MSRFSGSTSSRKDPCTLTSGVLGPRTGWRGRPGVVVEAGLTCNHVVA
jgi:hypothetical protein